jgi:GT2 family glycosyltransferase
MNKNQLPPKVSVGLVALNGAKYLPSCLKSVAEQTYPNIELLVIDNGSTDNTAALVKKNYPEIRFIKNPANLGFAGGHNQAIRETKGDYYLALNQDVILDPDYINSLVKAITKNPHIGAVQGKIKQLTWKRKTNMIDSLGLKLYRSGQVTNIAENEYDHGQFEAGQEIFGVAGTVPLYRRAALEDVSLQSQHSLTGREYFDETFFAYKEDIDLAFRLQLRQWRSFYVPEAIAYHERTVKSSFDGRPKNSEIIKNRADKSRFSRKVSFRNHHFLYQKNLLWGNFTKNAPELIWQEAKMWGYGLAKEPFLLPDMLKVFTKMPEMLHKRRQIMSRRKVDAVSLQRWFQDTISN